MFSQTVEYALRAAVCLAGNPGETLTVADVAEATKVPRAYLAKVLGGLTRAGVVVARRGVGGGVGLAKLPHEVTVLDIVNAVEPIRRITTCPLGLKAHGVHLCPLHKRVDAATATVEAAFASTTLAEILADPSPSVPLCDFPRVQELTKRPSRSKPG